MYMLKMYVEFDVLLNFLMMKYGGIWFYDKKLHKIDTNI